MSAPQENVINGLSDHYAAIFGEKYSDLYRTHIAGHRLAHDMTIEEYRANPVIRSFGCPPGPPVGDVVTIQIPVADGSHIPALVYYPVSYFNTKLLPCYINYHGGGWVIGNTGDDDAFNRSVAEACDAVVVDVGYRLAPEHKFPVAVFDAWEAYYYVASHASDLGVDPRRLAVGGFSAGAHLAAEVCLMARTEERDARWRYKPCFQLLVIPVCDAGALDDDLQVAKDCPYASWTEHHDAPFLSHARMSWFYRHFLHHSFNRHLLEQASLSPIRTDSLAGLPPALVVPAEVDVLRDEGIAFARKLAKESGNFTQLWLARNVPHPFPHQLDATDVAVEFRQLALQRLREAFNGELIGKKEFISNV